LPWIQALFEVNAGSISTVGRVYSLYTVTRIVISGKPV